MSIITKKVGFTIDVDESVIAPASVEVFLYQLINRLSYEHNIQSITVDDVTVAITSKEDLYNLPLGEDMPLTANKTTK